MSLYCVGKLTPLAPHRHDFVFPGHVHVSREMAPDDAKEFDKLDALSGEGIYFTVFDEPKAYEATGLWNEAYRQPADRVIQTRLGAFVHSLMFHPSIQVGGIAFIDGGIETIVEGSNKQCWDGFLARICRPWDAIDNPLFIWRA
jgi:hypothetical protein